MINVLATVQIKPGARGEFLGHFNEIIPAVRNENGCIEYFPAIDVEAGLDVQSLDSDSVTVIEKWESLEALYAHLKAPHMVAYKQKVKDLVVNLSLKILTDATSPTPT